MKKKETLEQKVVRERKLKELSFKVDSLIVKILKCVEEINTLKGIPEVRVGTRYFEESHEVLKTIGYDDSYGIVRFRIVLNKVGMWKWLWNPNAELVHRYYYNWNCEFTRENLGATVEMYENLIKTLEDSITTLNSLSISVNPQNLIDIAK